MIFSDRTYLGLCWGIGVIFVSVLGLFFLVLHLRGRNDRHAARWAGLEARWEGTLMELLSGSGRPEVIWALVDAKESLYFLKYLVRFHRTLAGEERQLIERLASPYLDALRARLRDPLPETRARAISTLTALGGTRFEADSAKALSDPSELVSMQAAWALAQARNPAYLPDILSHMDRYQSWSRGFLVSLFASMGESAAVTFRGILGSPARPPRQRALAAWVLRELNDYPSAAAAAALCRDESDPELLAAVIALLGQVGGTGHASVLRPHCMAKDESVRTHALRSLGQLGGQEDWMSLMASMADRSALVRMEAALAMMRAGGVEILRELSLSGDVRAPLARQALEGMP